MMPRTIWPNKHLTERMMVNISPRLRARLEAAAEREDVRASEYMRQALKRALDADGVELPSPKPKVIADEHRTVAA